MAAAQLTLNSNILTVLRTVLLCESPSLFWRPPAQCKFITACVNSVNYLGYKSPSGNSWLSNRGENIGLAIPAKRKSQPFSDEPCDQQNVSDSLNHCSSYVKLSSSRSNHMVMKPMASFLFLHALQASCYDVLHCSESYICINMHQRLPSPPVRKTHSATGS